MVKTRTLSNICQICILVKDIKRAMKQYALLGVGPFRVYAMDTRKMSGVTYRGKHADYSLEVAWATLGSWTLELLEPKRGENIYTEFMKKYGEGVHHIGMYVDDYDTAYARLVKMGYKQIQGGPIDGIDKTGRFDYFDTQKKYGIILEILDMPNDLGAPSYIYPSKSRRTRSSK